MKASRSKGKRTHTFRRRILLVVTGLSPQVVTETLYALAVQERPPWIPTEVHLITTREGAERARLTLLSKRPGWFHRLCRDYNLPRIRFDASRIHVLRDAQEAPLEDIRTPKDNESAADFITEKVRELTGDPNAALHVSIAGGRKTMGFYVGYALSLYGRPQDRLSHVLVSVPYESNQEFFYPTPYSHVIYTHPPENRPLDAKNARVTLASIPFVRLRHGLPKALLEGRARFSEVVAAAQENLGPPCLEIHLAQRFIRAGRKEIRLPAAQLAFLSWFARRRMKNEDPLSCPSDGVPDKAYAHDFLAEYRKVIGAMGDDERTAKALKDGMTKDYFLERKTRLNKALRDALGCGADPYLVQSFGRRPETRFGLDLPAKAIRFVEEARRQAC